MRHLDAHMATLRAAPRGLREGLGPGTAVRPVNRRQLALENSQLRAKYHAVAAKCDRMTVLIGVLQERLAHARFVA